MLNYCIQDCNNGKIIAKENSDNIVVSIIPLEAKDTLLSYCFAKMNTMEPVGNADKSTTEAAQYVSKSNKSTTPKATNGLTTTFTKLIQNNCFLSPLRFKPTRDAPIAKSATGAAEGANIENRLCMGVGIVSE